MDSLYQTVEEYQSDLANAGYRDIEILQTSAGAFNSVHSYALIGSTHFFCRDFESASIQQGILGQGLFCLLILQSYDDCQPPTINGNRIDSTVAAWPSDKDLFCTFPPQNIGKSYQRSDDTVSKVYGIRVAFCDLP